MDGRKISPCYMTWPPIGAAALLPYKKTKIVEQGKGFDGHMGDMFFSLFFIVFCLFYFLLPILGSVPKSD